jgi:DNA-binding response OmpR family regulator
MPETPSPVAATVLVYSDDAPTRERIRLAIGRRPARDVTVDYLEASTAAEVIEITDRGGVDLAILDGEAAPTGGLGVCRQLKAELDVPPPVLVLVGRHDDAWLATWSRADAVVPHPIDPMQLGRAVVDLLRGRAGASPLVAS